MSLLDPIEATKIVFKFEKPHKNIAESQQIITQPIIIHSVTIFGGSFGLRSGKNFGKNWNGATQLLQYLATNKNNENAQILARDRKHTSHKSSDQDMLLNMGYEIHMGS